MLASVSPGAEGIGKWRVRKDGGDGQVPLTHLGEQVAKVEFKQGRDSPMIIRLCCQAKIPSS